MVGSPFASSPEQMALREDLRFIRNHVSNAHYATLLDKRARELHQRNRLIPTRGPNAERILAVVAGIRTQIFEVSALDSGKNPNMEHHKQYAEILHQGIAALNTEANRSSARIVKDEMKEETAIQLDLAEIEETLRILTPKAPPTPQQIRVFNMDKPTEEPTIIEESFTNYRDVLFYLSNMRVVLTPELWVRHHLQHKLTKRGYKWEHVYGPERVAPLDVDVVDVANRKDYIVALVHGKTNDEEIPFPLEVNRLGDKSCCDPPCGNLGNHLRTIWPDRVVIQARRFSEDGNNAVLATALENTFFKQRTNDLYLLWTPTPGLSTRSPCQSP